MCVLNTRAKKRPTIFREEQTTSGVDSKPGQNPITPEALCEAAVGKRSLFLADELCVSEGLASFPSSANSVRPNVKFGVGE